MTPEAELLSLFRIEKHPEVVAFLEGNIRLPRKMSPRQPGPFSISQRPYMGPILECWNPNSGVNYCTLAGGTQILKTTILVLGVCYRIKYDPLPMLIVVPSEKFGQREISHKRLHPLVNENPVLAAEKPADGDLFKNLEMEMNGCHITVSGANSPTALSGASIGILAIDEACKIEHQEREEAPEAHPIELAFERTKDFEELALHYMSSSPNIPGHIFWRKYLAGDQTHFWNPCPHCREHFPFELIFDKNVEDYGKLIGRSLPADYKSVVWAKDSRDSNGLWIEEKVVETARYICPHNGCEIQDEHKPAMLTAYEQHRHNPNASMNNRSFRVSSFYSPRIKFGRIAWQFLSSLQDFFGLQSLYNSWLADTYEVTKKEIKEDKILKLKRAYRRRTIPTKPALLVLTADPGEKQTHWMVTAIMPNGELYVIDWGTVLAIETLLDPTWLVTLLYPVGDGSSSLRPQLGYIDSGDFTTRVYDCCVASGRFYWPTKGSATYTGSWAQTDIKSHPGLKGYSYVDHTAKTDLYGQRIGEGRPPAVNLPVDADHELIAGLSGQKLIASGHRDVWKKLPNDHFGDCLKLALIASWVGRAILLSFAGAQGLPAAQAEPPP